MKKTVWAAVAALGSVAFGATNEVAELPPVVVEASRLDKPVREVLGSVQVLTSRDIAASGARDAVDLLGKRAPALQVKHIGGSNPALAQILPQGYGENGFGRLLVLVDGERLNSPDMNAPNLSQIPFGAVRKIEILDGPQSVLHGDGAAGGVVNVTTEPADDDTHGHVELHGGSWNTIGGSFALRGGSAASGTRYWLNGGWDHSDGYRDFTGYDIWNVNAGVRQDFANGAYVRTSVFYNDSDYDVPGELSRAEWHHSPTLSKYLNTNGRGYCRRTTYGLNTTALGIVDEENSVKLGVSVSRRKAKSRLLSAGDGAWGPWTSESFFGYDTYVVDFNPEWINTTHVFGLDNELLAGALFRYERLHALTASDYGYGPSWSKYALDRQTMGFYALDTIRLAEDLALEFGGRYERIWSENTAALRGGRADDVNAYSAALLYTPLEDLKSYLRFSRFFNAPRLDETALNAAYVNDRLLRPEHGWRADVGADYGFLEEFSAGVNLFVAESRHEVLYDPITFRNNVNSPWDIRREGVNLRFAWERDKVAGVTAGYAFTAAELDGGPYDGNRVPLVAEQAVTLNGRVWIWDECFAFGGYRYQSDAFSYSDFANNGYGTGKRNRIPAYGVFHVGVQYAPETVEALRGLKFGFTVDNLFDRNYCDYAGYGQYYYPAAGRSYMFTVRYEF